MGVPLISRMRSPTWMEFFMSGLMQSGSTLRGQQAAGISPQPLHHHGWGCGPQAPPANGGQAVMSPESHLRDTGTCCHGTHESPL